MYSYIRPNEEKYTTKSMNCSALDSLRGTRKVDLQQCYYCSSEVTIYSQNMCKAPHRVDLTFLPAAKPSRYIRAYFLLSSYSVKKWIFFCQRVSISFDHIFHKIILIISPPIAAAGLLRSGPCVNPCSKTYLSRVVWYSIMAVGGISRAL